MKEIREILVAPHVTEEHGQSAYERAQVRVQGRHGRF